MSLPPGQPYRYKAFISYNHRDLKFAKSLHVKLEKFSFPSPNQKGKNKPLYPVFLDQNELKAGSTLSEAIQDAIRSSKYLIIICSENSVNSKWVKAELAFMKELNRDDDIIGVIPDKNGNELHLAEFFGQDSEHLAADFRPGKNKNLQLSKIAATIMEVELDELYRRESRRKNKQMLSLSAGLSVIAILMSTLAANAYFAEKEAVRQRGEKAQTYFDDRKLTSLSDDSILLQSRTLRQLSNIDEKQGELESAKERILSAHLASSLMIERQPNNIDAIREHGENSDYWGYIEYQLGKLEKAKDLSQDAKNAYNRGATLFPEDSEIAWKSAVGEQNIGIMILQLGRAAEARPYLERTLRAVEEQYETKNLNEEELYEYAGMYTWYIRALISFLYETRQKQLDLFKDMKESGARSIPNQSEKLNVERAVVILLLHSGRDEEGHGV